jgi:peptidoglycan/xylan/chitin deacetylase (PgdA/CDA1 family)
MRLRTTAATGVLLAGLAGLAAAFGLLPGGAALFVCGLALAAIGLHVVAGSADPALQVFGPAVCSANTGRPEVALTFDDGPDPASTPALLDALAAAGARATFFLLVDQAERHPELARAIGRAHEVGLHGLTHTPWLTLRHPAAGARELTDARDRLAALTGATVQLYRPPFGAVSPRLTEAVRRAGLTLVWCSVRTRDGGRLSEDAVQQRCQAASAGDIVLLHERRPSTARAMPAVFDQLRARGLSAVTVGDLCASR